MQRSLQDRAKTQLFLAFFSCQHEENPSLGWDGAQAAALLFFHQFVSAAVTPAQEQAGSGAFCAGPTLLNVPNLCAEQLLFSKGFSGVGAFTGGR